MLQRRQRLTEPEVAYYSLQLLDALRYLRDQRVIHRDLKLQNLLLASDMTLRVGDFGLAVRLDSAGQRRRSLCGTPNYIAPEVLRGQQDGHGPE